MNYQANLTTIGGTIKHARRLNTKSGLIMTWAVLDGYKMNMESLFFGPLAEAVLNLEQDAQVEIKGRLQSNSHKDDSGTWVNKIQLVTNQITLPGGQVVEGAKGAQGRDNSTPDATTGRTTFETLPNMLWP